MNFSKEDEDKIMFPQVEVLGKGVRKSEDENFFEMNKINGQDLGLNPDHQKFKKLVKDGKGKRIKIVGRKKEKL